MACKSLFYFLFLSHSLGYVFAQDCGIIRRCGVLKAPDCKDTQEIDCLTQLVKDCPDSEEAQKLLKGVQLAKKVLCDEEEVAKDFKQNAVCWGQMQACLQMYGKVNANDAEDKKCLDAKGAHFFCKNLPSVVGDCKTVVAKFVKEVDEELGCKKTEAPGAGSFTEVTSFLYLILISFLLNFI